MGTIIFIIIALILIAYILDAMRWLTFNALPITLAIVFSPVLPFYIAYKNRKEKPKQSKAILWVWGIVYFLVSLILIINHLN